MPDITQTFTSAGAISGDVAKGSPVGTRRAIQVRLDSGTTTATAYFTIPFGLPAYSRIIGYQIKNASALTYDNDGTATNVPTSLYIGNSITAFTNTASCFFNSGTATTPGSLSIGPPALTTLTTNWNTTSSEVTLYLIPVNATGSNQTTISQINTTAATNGMFLSGSNTKVDVEIVYDQFEPIPS